MPSTIEIKIRNGLGGERKCEGQHGGQLGTGTQAAARSITSGHREDYIRLPSASRRGVQVFAHASGADPGAGSVEGGSLPVQLAWPRI